MRKRSIGSLMRKKLSDITNSHQLHTFPSGHHHHSLQQLLQERATFLQLLAERDEIIELSGAELQRLQSDIKKLQLQNWNLAQSNTLILAELNLGRKNIKLLQHEILWRTALLKGNTANLQGKLEMDYEKNASLSQSQEGEENTWQPSTNPSNDEQHSYMNRKCIRRSTGSSTASTNNSNKDNRRHRRRHSTTCTIHEPEPLGNLFEIEDAKYLVTQPGPNMLSSPSVKDEAGESFGLRNEAPRSSFGRPLRRAAEKVQSYKEIPLNVKLRRLE